MGQRLSCRERQRLPSQLITCLQLRCRGGWNARSLSHGDFYAATVVERLGLGAEGLVRAGCACYTTEEEIDSALFRRCCGDLYLVQSPKSNVRKAPVVQSTTFRLLFLTHEL